MSTDTERALAAHQKELEPKRQLIQNDWTKSKDRWNGSRGAQPVTESERKMLEAADRNAGKPIPFTERMELLKRLRADMPKLKPVFI